MMQRIDELGAPLALALSPQSATPTASSDVAAGSVLRCTGGTIAAQLRQTAARNRRGQATYEMCVANDTAGPLAAFVGVLDAGASRSRVSWETIAVPPHSAIAVDVELALPRCPKRPRVVAELFGDDTQLSVDAAELEPQPARHRRGRLLAAAGCAALTAIAIAGTVAYQSAAPRVLALAAPAAVRDRAPFTVVYALDDASDARYFVETPQGDEIASGRLRDRAGSFQLTLPSAGVAQTYDVRVWTGSRFGSDQRSAHVVAQAKERPRVTVHHAVPHRSAPPQPAHVALMKLEHDVVRGGDDITITYRTTSPAGDISLVDQSGTVRAQTLLNERGRSLLVAPHVDVDQDFRISLVTQRGGTRDEAKAALTILKDDPSLPGQRSAVLGPIAFNPNQIVGRPIVVNVLRYEPGLHVALMGALSQEVAGANVAPDDTTIALNPPKGETRAHYDIVATYTSGLGQETLVHPVALHAGTTTTQ